MDDVTRLDIELKIKVRERIYEKLISERQHYFDLRAHFSRWLVSSLLLIHGAGIGFIAHSDRLSESLIPWSFAFLIVGLFFAMVCGFASWINLSLFADIYNEVNANMILSDEAWPKFNNPRLNRWLPITYWSALGTGIMSFVMAIIAAIAAAIALAP